MTPSFPNDMLKTVSFAAVCGPDLKQECEAGVSVGDVGVAPPLPLCLHQLHDDSAQAGQTLVDAASLPEVIPCCP